MPILIVLIVTFVSSILCTVGIRSFAKRHDIVDVPGDKRKIHKKPIPLLGGAAVIISFIIGVIVAYPSLTHGYLFPKHLVGVLFAAVAILVGGALDDKYNLPPKKQFFSPLIAAVIIIASGIGIEYVSNPFGNTIYLNSIHFTLFTYQGLPYGVTLFADVFTVLWLLGMMYTTKFLDGLDGLVSGISVIGSFIIFWLSMSKTVFQPETAWLSLIVGCAFLGFLTFNTNPASIFLGESGSLFAGFILGVLAIISGGKIATALLIMGIPILDVIWVIIRRFLIERRSPFQADRKHLHLRLIDVGFTQRQAVLILYMLTALFGASSLFLQSHQKVLALVVLVIVMCILGGIIVWKHRQKN